MKSRRYMRSISKHSYPYILIAPALLLFLLFELYPMLQVGYFSLHEKVAGSPAQYVGLQNFVTLLSDPAYRRTAYNTVVFILTNVMVKIPLAFLAALFLLSLKGWPRRTFRVLILLPWVTPDVPYLIMWRYILDPDYGVLSEIYRMTALPRIVFLADPNYTIYVLAIIHAWKYLPFFAVIFLAGLVSIPTEIVESAFVDGASMFQRLRHITFPLMKKLITLCYFLSIVWMLGEFITVWVLTKGGPAGTTHLFATLAYLQGFQLTDFGLASTTLALTLPLAVPLIIAITILLGRR